MPTRRIGNADIYYQDEDFADPWKPHDTVFIQHGFCRNSNMFHAWVPHLSRDYRVVRMDLRGLGQSADPGPDYRFSVDDLLGDILGLWDSLGIDKVHYAGESLGGLLGIALAANHPERIKSLTLISTIVQVEKESASVLNTVGFDSRTEAMRALGMKQWWLRYREGTGDLTGDTAMDHWFADEVARTPVHVACALWEFAPTVSVGHLLPKVQAPTLVLSPGLSRRTRPQEQERIVREIPNARQVRYDDGRHLDCYLRPDRLAKETLAFIREQG